MRSIVGYSCLFIPVLKEKGLTSNPQWYEQNIEKIGFSLQSHADMNRI